jgi:hypothetical protein
MKAGARSAADLHNITIVQHEVGAYVKFSELFGNDMKGTVRVFRQGFTLDAIGSHACSLEALACV